MDIIDKDRIYVMGYSLGGTVGLYGAALDERIKGVVSVCGFTPMRLNGSQEGRGGIYIYSHLHGLAPKLGFFVDYEDRIPYDYHEIIAAIAPRPVLITAPTWDRYADFNDVKNCVEQVRGIYDLLGAGDKLELFAPEEYNQFSDKTRDKIWEWIPKNFK
jgi:pimeloyl-ACP methyl ester carboxylesterase